MRFIGLFFLLTFLPLAGAVTFQPTTQPVPQIPAADLAQIEPENIKPGLPIRLEGEKLIVGGKTLASRVRDLLVTGDAEPWQVKREGKTEIFRKPFAGVVWERTVIVDKKNCLTLKHRVCVEPYARCPALVAGYQFYFKEGDIFFDRVTVPRINVLNYERREKIFQLGDFPPYLIYANTKTNERLHVYIPNYLDLAGQMEIFREPAHPDHVAEDTRALVLNLAFQTANFVSIERQTSSPRSWEIYDRDWKSLPKTLKPGESLNFEIRFAAFNDRPMDLGKKDQPQYFTRGELLCLGFPLPMQPVRKTGHFFTVRWCLIDPELKFIDDIAKAGGKYLVFRSPDYEDISHGVSWDGDYAKGPPNIAAVLEKTHKLGMKALWWFSIRGVMRDKDPLLKQHPDWFHQDFYWSNLYQHADMFNEGWKNWIIEKIKSDLTKYSLDGMAFDEPHYNGVMVSDTGVTHCRNGYEFMKRLNQTVKSFGQNKILIANYWIPYDDEWKYFDYLMTESSGEMYLNNLTLGRHSAGWPIGVEHFVFQKTLNLIAYNFCDYNQTAGWTHPEWLFSLQKDPGANKSVNDLARLLALCGRGNRLWGAEITKDLRQIEADVEGKPVIILCNTSLDKTIQGKVSLHKIRPEKAFAVRAVIDTKNRTETFNFSWNPQNATVLEVNSIPPQSIVTLYLDSP